MGWVNVSEYNGQVTLAISECELILFFDVSKMDHTHHGISAARSECLFPTNMLCIFVLKSRSDCSSKSR